MSINLMKGKLLLLGNVPKEKGLVNNSDRVKRRESERGVK